MRIVFLASRQINWTKSLPMAEEFLSPSPSPSGILALTPSSDGSLSGFLDPESAQLRQLGGLSSTPTERSTGDSGSRLDVARLLPRRWGHLAHGYCLKAGFLALSDEETLKFRFSFRLWDRAGGLLSVSGSSGHAAVEFMNAELCGFRFYVGRARVVFGASVRYKKRPWGSRFELKRGR